MLLCERKKTYTGLFLPLSPSAVVRLPSLQRAWLLADSIQDEGNFLTKVPVSEDLAGNVCSFSESKRTESVHCKQRFNT